MVESPNFVLKDMLRHPIKNTLGRMSRGNQMLTTGIAGLTTLTMLPAVAYQVIDTPGGVFDSIRTQDCAVTHTDPHDNGYARQDSVPGAPIFRCGPLSSISKDRMCSTMTRIIQRWIQFLLPSAPQTMISQGQQYMSLIPTREA